MKKYGYIITSEKADEFMENLQVLLAHGCDELFIEGSLEGEDELIKLASKLTPGDEVIVPTLAMFPKSAVRGQRFAAALIEQAASLRVLSKNLEARGHLCLPPELKVVGQQAKREYKPGTMGRPKIEQSQVEAIIKYRTKERLTYREISELTELSLGTVYKYIKSYQEKD